MWLSSLQNKALLLDSMPNGLMAINLIGDCLWANQRLRDWLGLPRASALPSLQQSLSSVHFGALNDYLSKEKTESGGIVVSIATRSGRSIPLQLREMPREAFDAQLPTGVYILSAQQAIDLQLEQELAAARKREQAQQQLLSSMSHEIHNSANVIAGIAHAMRHPDHQEQLLEQLEYTSDFLVNLTDNLLYHAQLKDETFRVKRKVLNLHKLLASIAQVPNLSLRQRDVRFEYHQQGDLPKHIIGDKTAIYQIVLNLLSNAVKYTQTGSITLTTETVHAGRFLQISVSDTGVGISEQDLEAIFQRYYRGVAEQDSSVRGAGLGLNIAMKLAELMGGELSAESKVGVGSTFRFLLPLEHVETGATPSNPVQPMSRQPLRVLIMEDNPLCRNYLEDVVSRAACAYHSCTNGLEALNAFEKHTFDLALLDLNTPLLNGYELALSLRAMTDNPNRNIPLVALTGDLRAEMDTNLLESGIQEVITKPFEPQQLNHLLQQYARCTRPDHQKSFSFSIGFDKNNLGQLYGARYDHLLSIFEVFLRSLPKSLASMAEHLATGNWEGMAKEAHKVKPNFSLVGVPSVTATAQALETVSLQHCSEDRAKQLFQQFREEAVQCLRLVETEAARLRNFLRTDNYDQSISN